jgi:hypothetical protein
MTLETYPVDFDPIRLDELDNLLSSLRFRAIIFEIVVVVVEFRIWISLRSNTECNWNKCLSNDIVKDTVPVGSIFVQRYTNSY